jgi:glycosyltransferase involved in cell wall biosynthesis
MCYPGTLNWHQGIDIAIQALALLRNTASNVHFLIVGDGPCRKDLIQLAKELNLEDKVTFREPVPMEEVAAIMANVDIGVVPKRSNSFGNEAFSTKIMEFMSMGVPVIAARTAIDQHYFDENIVRFFESGDAADLAAKIAALAESAEQREILRGNADVFIAKNGWDVKQAEYMDVLNQTLAGRSRAARSATTEN